MHFEFYLSDLYSQFNKESLELFFKNFSWIFMHIFFTSKNFNFANDSTYWSGSECTKFVEELGQRSWETDREKKYSNRGRYFNLRIQSRWSRHLWVSSVRTSCRRLFKEVKSHKTLNFEQAKILLIFLCLCKYFCSNRDAIGREIEIWRRREE